MGYMFTLRPEHLKLLPELCFEVRFRTAYGDEAVPGINTKRPFGNSSVTYDVCRRLQFAHNDEDEYSHADEMRAMSIIAELPFALAFVLRTHIFEPGVYELDECTYSSEIFHDKIYRNYLSVYPALQEVRETEACAEVSEQIVEMFGNNCSDDPFRDIPFLERCLEQHGTPGLAKALEILKKHCDAYRRAKEEGTDTRDSPQ